MSNGHTTITGEQLGLLDDLAMELATQTRGIPVAARQIIGNSLPQVLERSPLHFVPAYAQLGKIKIRWQLFLESRENKMIFYFLRKKTFNHAFTTDINMSIVPVEQLRSTNVPAQISHFWTPPRFIEVQPAATLVKPVEKKNNKNNRKNVLWTRLGASGNDLLAIAFRNPGRRPQSQLFYFKNGEKPFTFATAKEAPLEWYLELLAAMRPWISGEKGDPLSIDLNHSEGEIKKTLEILSKNFLTITNELATTQNQEVSANSALQYVYPYYQLSDYAVNVRLRLTSDGKIVKRLSSDEMKTMVEEERIFQLLVNLQGKWQKGQPSIHFNILPPDFLVEGPLFDSFLQVFLKTDKKGNPGKNLKDLAKKLNTSVPLVREALTTYASEAFIFRINRAPQWDTQMFILFTRVKGRRHPLIFSGKFKADLSNNTVRNKNKKFNNHLVNVNGRLKLDNKGVKYLLNLLFMINDWKNKVVR